MTTKEKRTERRKLTAEVFTPTNLVKEMLEKLPKEVWEDDKTFLDPACGTGNMIICVLIEKIKNGHNHKQALGSIYGVDIMPDNIKELKIRLVILLKKLGVEIDDNIKKIIKKNFVCTPLDKYPNGSLDYDFDFE